MTCRTIIAVALAALALLSTRSSAAEHSVSLSPGSTDAPGPALEQSVITFQWSAVQGANGYRLLIRDLDNNQVDDFKLGAEPSSTQVELIAGHRYAWHIVALLPDNTTVESVPRYFKVETKPVHPTISGVVPHPIPAVHGAQVLLLNGKEFRRGSSVILRDKTTKERFGNLKQTVSRMNQIVVTPNFARAAGPWSVEIVNPGGFSSGEFLFDVVVPERIPRWNWLHSGWPWASAAFAMFCLAAITAWWIRFQLNPRKLALLSRAVRIDERDRFVRDLHDRASADISYLARLADDALHQSSTLSAETHGQVRQIYSAARDVEMAIGDLIWAADPHNETLRQLASRLHARIRERLESHKIEADFSNWPAPVPNIFINSDLSRETLYLCHEVLNNVIKHSRASQVFCTLAANDGSLVLGFRDNGTGFDVNGQNAGRRGLANIRERAEKLGGSVEIKSSPGAGAEIVISLPLPVKDAPTHTKVIGTSAGC